MSQFTVGGVQFTLSREDVEVKLKDVAPEPVRELYVMVNGQQFPIKQALAEAAGMQRGMFTSHDAMRVFRRLSIPIGPDELPATETTTSHINGNPLSIISTASPPPGTAPKPGKRPLEHAGSSLEYGRSPFPRTPGFFSTKASTVPFLFS